MNKDIEESIRLLLENWVNVSSPAKTLILSLKDNNFTPSEIEIIGLLRYKYLQGKITDSQIEELIESIETETQENTEKIEDLINDYELDAVSKDPFFISSKNAYLQSLFNRKQKNIVREVYQKLDLPVRCSKL